MLPITGFLFLFLLLYRASDTFVCFECCNFVPFVDGGNVNVRIEIFVTSISLKYWFEVEDFRGAVIYCAFDCTIRETLELRLTVDGLRVDYVEVSWWFMESSLEFQAFYSFFVAFRENFILNSRDSMYFNNFWIFFDPIVM